MNEMDPLDDCLAELIAEGFGSITPNADAAWLRRRLKEAGFAIVPDEAQALERGREVKLPSLTPKEYLKMGDDAIKEVKRITGID